MEGLLRTRSRNAAPRLIGAAALSVITLAGCTGEGHTTEDDCTSYDRTVATANSIGNLRADILAQHDRADYTKVIRDDGHIYINSVDRVPGRDKLVDHVEARQVDGRWEAFVHYQCID